MAHWGWYWKIKLNHKPKRLCSSFCPDLGLIDSFKMFKNKEGVEACMNKQAFSISRYDLKAFLYESHYLITYSPSDGMRGCYKIPIEKQPCNYGGFRYFFYCPQCHKRMRILYLHKGIFLCRRCLNLGYYSQQIRSSSRYLLKSLKIKKFLESKSGSLDKKPPRMWKKTFNKLRLQHFDSLEIKSEEARHKEFMQDHPNLLPESELREWRFFMSMARYELKAMRSSFNVPSKANKIGRSP